LVRGVDFSLRRVVAFGYSWMKSFDELISLLRKYDVEILVDIRRFPRSKNPDFIRENLESKLPKYGVKYVYMGDVLGGFRKGGYERYTKTKDFQDGIIRLRNLAENAGRNGRGVAIMCLEKKSRYCHRRFIIEHLRKIKVEVVEVES